MFSEFRVCFEILFADQKHSADYKELMDELDAIADDARDIASRNGGWYSDSDFEAIKECAYRLMSLLRGDSVYGSCADYGYTESLVHKLLANETFFKEAFPSA